MGTVSVAARGTEARGAVGAAATHAWGRLGTGLRTDGKPGRTGFAVRGLCGTDWPPAVREHEARPRARFGRGARCAGLLCLRVNSAEPRDSVNGASGSAHARGGGGTWRGAGRRRAGSASALEICRPGGPLALVLGVTEASATLCPPLLPPLHRCCLEQPERGRWRKSHLPRGGPCCRPTLSPRPRAA